MSLLTELRKVLSKLPPLSENYNEDELVAQVMLSHQSLGWDFYLTEYDPIEKIAHGLVDGYDIEYGPIELDRSTDFITNPPTVIFNFEPEKVSKIRERLEQRDIKYSSLNEQFQHDVFISYATEDEQYASQIAGALQFSGIRIWFAPLSLKIGDQLLQSLEEGMRGSAAGILLISPNYIKKQWTRMEFDNLIRQFIEQGKRILPLWHGVTKENVDKFSSTLGGIFALNTQQDFEHIINNINHVLSHSAPTIASIPTWEHPVHRFKRGLGELQIYKNVNGQLRGAVFYVWDLLLNFSEDQFPIFVNGQFLNRDELLVEIASVFSAHPKRILEIAGQERFDKLRKMCEDHGHNTSSI